MMNNLFWAVVWSVLVVTTIQCAPKEQNTTTPQPNLETTPPVNDLPDLTVRQTNGQHFSLRAIEGKTILIFFNPGCDHCERQAGQIKNRKQLFKNHSVYFVSTENADALIAFANQYELIEKNFLFAQADAAAVFEAVGNLPSVPAIFIYTNKKLIKRFDGETNLDVMQPYL